MIWRRWSPTARSKVASRGSQRASTELLEIRSRIESGVFLDNSPDERWKRQNVSIREDHIHYITRLTTVGERDQLVDREIDRVQHDTATLDGHQRQESPR